MKGERQEEKEEKNKDYYLQERCFGSFQRSFELPESVDADKIEASFKKGVLTAKLPKKPRGSKVCQEGSRSRPREWLSLTEPPESPGFFLSPLNSIDILHPSTNSYAIPAFGA